MDKKLTIVIVIGIIVAALPILSRFTGSASSPSQSVATANSNSNIDSKVIGVDVTSALSRNDWNAVTGKFDATMKAALTANALADTWNALVAQAGAFKKQQDARVEKVQGMDVVIVPCEFDKAKINVQVTVNASGEVSGLYLRPAA